MASELDDLMDIDPLDLTSDNIDDLIAKYRARRAASEAGVKPKRESGPKADLSSIMDGLVKKPAVTEIKRRV